VTSKIPIYRLKLVKECTMQVSERELDKPFAVARFIERWVGTDDREHLVAIFLDADCRIVGAHVVAVGSLDHAHTTAREVFKAAIVANAHGLILGHNHPSGCLDPSESDIRSTKKLIYLGTMLGIRVLDHVIVSRNGFRSMHEMGLVPTSRSADADAAERGEPWVTNGSVRALPRDSSACPSSKPGVISGPPENPIKRNGIRLFS
jgi:DNA repair protein RadC